MHAAGYTRQTNVPALMHNSTWTLAATMQFLWYCDTTVLPHNPYCSAAPGGFIGLICVPAGRCARMTCKSLCTWQTLRRYVNR